jgi:hypothetical protein
MLRTRTCNQIHVTLPAAGELAATLDAARLLQDTNLLQGLADVAD